MEAPEHAQPVALQVEGCLRIAWRWRCMMKVVEDMRWCGLRMLRFETTAPVSKEYAFSDSAKHSCKSVMRLISNAFPRLSLDVRE